MFLLLGSTTVPYDKHLHPLPSDVCSQAEPAWRGQIFPGPRFSDESYGYELADSSSRSCGMCWCWNCGLDSGGMKTIMFMDMY